MKRVRLVVGSFSLAVFLAGFMAGCGPEEKYCVDQHTTCKQAKLDEAARKQQEEEERLRRLDALGDPGDGGSIVIEH